MHGDKVLALVHHLLLTHGAHLASSRGGCVAGHKVSVALVFACEHQGTLDGGTKGKDVILLLVALSAGVLTGHVTS